MDCGGAHARAVCCLLRAAACLSKRRVLFVARPEYEFVQPGVSSGLIFGFLRMSLSTRYSLGRAVVPAVPTFEHMGLAMAAAT